MAGKIVLVGAGLVVLVGCAPQLDRMEAELQRNADEIAKLRAEQQHLSQEIETVNNLLRLDQNNGAESNALRLARLGQLATKMDQLIYKLDDNAEYMRNLSARVDLLASRAGIPTVGEYKGVPPGEGTLQGMDELPEEGRAIFQAAQLDRNRGNTEMAREGLEEFLTKYGNSELADDALYWLGDLSYGEKEYSQALSQFQDLFDRFPSSERIPAALLKSAYCLQSLGRPIESQEFLQRLVDQYPDSPEAAQARERLSDASSDDS